MDVRKSAAMCVLVVIAAVVAVVVWASVGTWRNRSNPTITNQGPVNQPMQSRPPA